MRSYFFACTRHSLLSVFFFLLCETPSMAKEAMLFVTLNCPPPSLEINSLIKISLWKGCSSILNFKLVLINCIRGRKQWNPSRNCAFFKCTNENGTFYLLHNWENWKQVTDFFICCQVVINRAWKGGFFSSLFSGGVCVGKTDFLTAGECGMHLSKIGTFIWKQKHDWKEFSLPWRNGSFGLPCWEWGNGERGSLANGGRLV